MMKAFTLCLAAAVMGGAAGLAGCSSAPTRTYALYTAAPPPAASPYAGPPVRIDATHVPPTLNRIEIVTNVTAGELRINDLDHWSAPLTQLIRQTLTADLAARLPPGAVIYPHLTKPEGALGISVDILEFVCEQRGSALTASYTIGASPSTASRGTVQLRGGSGGASPAATTQALSELLGQLAARISADLAARGQGP